MHASSTPTAPSPRPEPELAARWEEASEVELEIESENLSPWLPLQVPIFRAFWIASIVSNLGTWVHEVGAGWLMTNLDASPAMVSSVRIAISLPTVCLAIPAGVLADRIDRRHLLILTQLILFCTTATLASLTLANLITSWTLLGLTFVMGLGTVLHVLAWQATVPALVPTHQLSRAVALGSLSFNLARSVGPALGGLLIAFAGVWITFAVNAVSFAGVLLVLARWRREPMEMAAEHSFALSLKRGARFVGSSQKMQRVLMSLPLFLIPATSLWALLPLIAREHLQWDARGFGVLVTTIGIGAVTAARFLHLLHHRFGVHRTITVAMLQYAASLWLLATVPHAVVALPAMLVIGAAWMMTLTSLNASAQLELPEVLRARGMGFYLSTLAGSMSAGALLWGQIAGYLGLATSLQLAAAGLAVTALLRNQIRI